MIDCRMELKDNELNIRLKGHAGYGPEGSDIVCSAATTLCNTLSGYLADKPMQKCRLEKGDIEININLDKCPQGIWEVINFVAVGFQVIAYSFPNYFDLKKNF